MAIIWTKKLRQGGIRKTKYKVMIDGSVFLVVYLFYTISGVDC